MINKLTATLGIVLLSSSFAVAAQTAPQPKISTQAATKSAVTQTGPNQQQPKTATKSGAKKSRKHHKANSTTKAVTPKVSTSNSSAIKK